MHTPLGHVLDQELLDVGIIGSVSMQIVTLLFGAALLLYMMPRIAKRISTGPSEEGNERYVTKGRIAQIVEVICLYLRDEMLMPVMGEKNTKKYFSLLMSLFFFVLVMNLLGLVPLPDLQNIIGKFGWGDDHWSVIGGTPTSNINITAGLALVSFVVIQIHSYKELGILGWLDHLTCGLMKGSKMLWPVVPIIFVVEIAGIFIKPAALAIRLFANMVGGHVLLATLLLFGAEYLNAGLSGWAVGAISLVSGIAAVLITFMELFVAFLQAFIFMFLTAVFISLMSHSEEEHDTAEEAPTAQPAS